MVNRTATFVFTIGERFYGVVTAHVTGPAAAGYGFTSSLPVQLFRVLAPPIVVPLLGATPTQAETPASVGARMRFFLPFSAYPS